MVVRRSNFLSYPPSAPYPSSSTSSSLKLKITQHIIPSSIHPTFINKLIIIHPPSHSIIPLKLSITIDHQPIDHPSFIPTHLFSELHRQLDLIVKDDSNRIQGMGPIRLDPSIPNACFVDLKVSPIERSLEEALTELNHHCPQPIGRLESIDLHLQLNHHHQSAQSFDIPANNLRSPNELHHHHELKHQQSPPPTPQTHDPVTPPLLPSSSPSLSHLHPLSIYTKSSLQYLIQDRFLRRNLLIQLALIFNSSWRKSLIDSLPIHASVARILTRFLRRSISDELRSELMNLSSRRPSTGLDSRDHLILDPVERVERGIRCCLLELQMKSSKRIPTGLHPSPLHRVFWRPPRAISPTTSDDGRRRRGCDHHQDAREGAEDERSEDSLRESSFEELIDSDPGDFDKTTPLERSGSLWPSSPSEGLHSLPQQDHDLTSIDEIDHPNRSQHSSSSFDLDGSFGSMAEEDQEVLSP